MSKAAVTSTPVTAPPAYEVRFTTPSLRALELEGTSFSQLEKVFLRGSMPDVDALVGWEFRGINAPNWARLVGIKKFIKGFYRDEHGQAMGYNCPVEQNKLAAAWHARPDDAAPKRFGFYQVGPVDPTATDNKYLHSVLLDYGKGGNPASDPSRGLRDYVVQVDPGNPDLYLGKAYFALGGARIPTSFFIIERHRRGLTEYVRR